MAHDAFLGTGGLVLLLALFALKPLVTALCLGSGASGGLFTPMATATATAVARHIDGCSIYSARLRARPSSADRAPPARLAGPSNAPVA